MDKRTLRRKPRETVNCIECQQPFEVIAGNPKNRRWCSIRCAYAGIKSRTKKLSKEIPCKYCGKIRIVFARDFHRKRSLFCDKDCMWKYRYDQRKMIVLQKLCVQCAQLFEVTPGAVRGTHKWSYCSEECYKAWRGDQTRKRDGERYLNPHGYVEVYCYDHPSVAHKPQATRRVGEHRLVMEKLLGRFLHPWETVHHKDRDRQNNDPGNLELWNGKQPSGVRVADVYARDIERLALENHDLKQRLETLEKLQYVAV